MLDPPLLLAAGYIDRNYLFMRLTATNWKSGAAAAIGFQIRDATTPKAQIRKSFLFALFSRKAGLS